MKTSEFEHNCHQFKEKYTHKEIYNEIIAKNFSSKIIKTIPSLGAGNVKSHCYNCGFEISISFSFCPNCGRALTEIGNRICGERVKRVIFKLMKEKSHL